MTAHAGAGVCSCRCTTERGPYPLLMARRAGWHCLAGGEDEGEKRVAGSRRDVTTSKAAFRLLVQTPGCLAMLQFA
ncbi:MAG: hypothetical protein UC390_00325 [Peptococcaceae bacterium]|nr:hypothetical protein [Peptococcaceae bacterium]